MSRNLREALNDVVGVSTWRPDNTMLVADAEKWTTLVGYIVMATNGDNDGQVPMGCEDAEAQLRAEIAKGVEGLHRYSFDFGLESDGEYVDRAAVLALIGPTDE